MGVLAASAGPNHGLVPVQVDLSFYLVPQQVMLAAAQVPPQQLDLLYPEIN